MTLKTTIHTLSFIIAASTASLALASGLGAGADADAKVAAPVGGQPAATVLGNAPTAATDVAKDVKGTANATADTTGATTDAAADKSAATNADTHLADRKAKSKKVKSGKSQIADDTKAGAGASAKGDASSGS